MEVELIRRRKAKLETEASELLLRSIIDFEMDTGVEVRGGTISGLGWHSGADGLSLEREAVMIRFELEAI